VEVNPTIELVDVENAGPGNGEDGNKDLNKDQSDLSAGWRPCLDA